MKYLLILALAISPATAFATSFVYDGGPIGNWPDGGPLVFPKLTNVVQNGIAANKQLFSDDANAFWQDLLDLRSAILSGYFDGLAQLSSAPPAPASGFIFFNLNGVFTLEFSDGSLLPMNAFLFDGGAGLAYGNMASLQVPSLDAGTVFAGTLRAGSIDAGPVKTTLLIANAIDAGPARVATLDVAGGLASIDGSGDATAQSLSTQTVFWTGNSSQQSSAVYETPSGRIGATDSPQVAFAYTTHCSAQVMRCSWKFATVDGAATGNLTFSVARSSDAHVYCTKTQRCDGKYDDAGSPAVVAMTGYLDCNTPVATATDIIAGTGDSCSARPAVNYVCQIACP